MARKGDFMKWIDHQVDTDAGLERKVEEYLNEMIIEQKLTALRTQRGFYAKMNVTSRGGERLQ